MELADEATRLGVDSLLPPCCPTQMTDGMSASRPIRGEAKAKTSAELLAAAFGDAWRPHASQFAGQVPNHEANRSTPGAQQFFTQHLQSCSSTAPYLAHLDGLKDGFAALVNYHKLGWGKTLETLDLHLFIGDWMENPTDDSPAVDGAQEKARRRRDAEKEARVDP